MTIGPLVDIVKTFSLCCLVSYKEKRSEKIISHFFITVQFEKMAGKLLFMEYRLFRSKYYQIQWEIKEKVWQSCLIVKPCTENHFCALGDTHD